MARYKPYDVNQVTLIPVSFRDQILPGSFEYALNEIVDEHIDLRPFEARYQNDETGCLAYDPAILLKIVLFGYYKGIISSLVGYGVRSCILLSVNYFDNSDASWLVLSEWNLTVRFTM